MPVFKRIGPIDPNEPPMTLDIGGRWFNPAWFAYMKSKSSGVTPPTTQQPQTTPQLPKPSVPFQTGHLVNPEWMNRMKQMRTQQPQTTQPRQTFYGGMGINPSMFRNLLNPSYFSQGQQTTQDDYSAMGSLSNRGLYPSSMYNQPQYFNLLSPRYNLWNRR